MGGTTKKYNTTPQSTQRLRDPVIDYLMGQVGGASGFGTQGYGTGSPFDRINAGVGTPTKSIDELGGADSPFFQNMVARYQPAFDQQRTLALASAKEGAGTLTGSGFANRLGTTVNRSLADQNNILSQIGMHGLDLESARQQATAQMEAERQRSNAGNFLQLLLGQSMAGVSPDQIVSKGGLGALLGPLAQLFGIYQGSKGTGGGGDINIPSYIPPPNIPSNFPTYQP